MQARGRHTVDYPLLFGGRYIGIGMEPGLFVGDTRAHRYVRIAPGYGSLLTGVQGVLVAQPVSGADKVLTHMAISFIPLADVPAMPPCAA